MGTTNVDNPSIDVLNRCEQFSCTVRFTMTTIFPFSDLTLVTAGWMLCPGGLPRWPPKRFGKCVDTKRGQNLQGCLPLGPSLAKS